MKTILPMLALTAISAAAAPYSVTSTVTEAPSGETCVGATVKVYQPADSAATVKFAVTDIDGRFTTQLPAKGDYVAHVSYIGCKDATLPFALTASAPDLTLPDIKLQRDDQTLEEFTVVARRKLITSDGATLTYNVEQDPVAQTSSTLDMLRHVPMVTVDAQDNVKVNGQSNFKIYINGKEDPMLRGDVATVLKSMPASTIKKVEVITEPGAKYDAEGSGGILNIITTTKSTVEGYLANVSLNAYNQGVGGSVYAMTKINKVTASLQGSYMHSSLRRHMDATGDTEYIGNEAENRQLTSTRTHMTPYHFGGLDANVSWEPDTLNLFTVGFNWGSFGSANTNEHSATMFSSLGEKVWSYSRRDELDNSSDWMSLTASFQHTFRKEGHHIIGSYIFDHGSDETNSETRTYDIEGIAVDHPWRNRLGSSRYHKHTLQIDYANPFDEHHLLEAGFKGSWRPDKGLSSQGYGQSQETILPDPSQSINVTQFQDIMALYVSYTGNYGKWNVKAGLRYEHTRMGMDYRTPGYDDFTTYLNDLVPNAAVTYKFDQASNLRLAYQMRIDRPMLGQLNPFRNTMTIGQVSYGNPVLDSAHDNSVSLTYSNYGSAVSGSVGISYGQTDNNIEQYSFLDEGNLICETYANIGHHRSTTLSGNLQWTPMVTLQLGVSGAVSYEDYRAESPRLTASNSGFNGYFNANADYTLPCQLRLSAYGGWGSPWIGLQTDGGSGWYYYGIGLSRSFLKEKRLTVNVMASNILPSHRTGSSSSSYAGVRYTQTYTYPQWGVGISVSYRLGSLSARVRTTDANLSTETGNTGNTSTGAGPR